MLQDLEKHAFYSVAAVFQDLDGKNYSLSPLKYTPRYSVIFEIDPDRLFVTQFDPTPGETQVRGDAEKMAAAQYEAFIKSLPRETDRAVRGELP
jgi:hypothetical protein